MDFAMSLPLVIFYLTLLVNTYFSVRLFFGIVNRKDISNVFIDIVLVFLYCLLAWFLNDQRAFLAIACLLFAVATLKYVSMLIQKRYASYSKTIRRKIALDLIGFLYSLIAFSLMGFLGQGTAVWIWSIGFVFANIYLLLIKPFYIIYDKSK